MNEVYLVCVQGSYLRGIENFSVSFTEELTKACFLDYEDALKKVNDLIMLGYDAKAIQYNFQEVSDPKKFTKKGLYAIKMNDGSYWMWDYFGNVKTTPQIGPDSFLTSYKECQNRIKHQKLNGKAIQLQN